MEHVQKKDIPYFLECEALVQGLGYQLVELSASRQKSGWQVRAIIHTPEGIGVNDCSKVHRALVTRLEAVLGSQDLSMEVSSPGLSRLIKKTIEFPAFIGENIKVWDATITEWREGCLLSCTDEGLCLKTGTGEITVLYDDIKKGKLDRIHA